MSELNKKTLNPSEEKGFIERVIEILQQAKKDIEPCVRINNAIAILKANGESPEVDNPVGQVNIEIVDDFLDQFEGNWIKEDYLILQEFVKYINKPLETTKEQPKYYFYRIEFTNDNFQRETLCGTLSSDINPIKTFENFKRLHNNKSQLSILSFNLLG